MPGKTSVGCIDTATEILGDKWTPRLLRLFMNEDSVRFCQLQDMSGGINPRTLSNRLGRLEQNGVVAKDGSCYVLTEKGLALLPILRGMETWSELYA